MGKQVKLFYRLPGTDQLFTYPAADPAGCLGSRKSCRQKQAFALQWQVIIVSLKLKMD
ncbi:hypothetical protein [Paenibacillus ihuae]|uniref:hypothetical protein n=1 Tax=Paenibacillus ihuae TaxID=1232431 RepID=UPI00131C7196|nr:hypothetical protein [Paenibacillus ihuae]